MASTRQLSQLLQEKQEPFLLDVYLLQNGCSSKKLERIGRSRRRGSTVGFLKSIVSKLVHRKAALAKVLNWDHVDSFESGRMSSVFSCFSSISFRELLDGDHKWRCIEEEELDCKQLSPVSVLHRFKEENQSSTSISDSPTHCTAEKGHGQRLLLDCVTEAEERVCEYCLSPESRAKAIREKLHLWQSLNGDVSTLSELVSSDFAEFRDEWSRFRPEMKELGVEIEAVVFEEILLEILCSHCT